MDKKQGLGKKIAAFFGRLILFGFIMLIIYAAYLLLIFKKMPSAMSEVSSLYSTVAAARMSPAAAVPQTAKVSKAQSRTNWTTVNHRTTDKQLEALNVGPKEIVKLETYDKILDSSTLQVINQFMELVTGKKNSGVMSTEQSKEMKRQVEEILAAFKEREEALKEIDK